MDNVGEIKDTQVKDKVQEETTDLAEIAKLLDKDMFFTASVANKKTTAVQKKRLEVSMLEVYKEINTAINAGEFSVTLWLTNDQKNFLYNKNFRLNAVERGNSKIKCQIYWN